VDRHPRVLRVLRRAHLDGELEGVRELARDPDGFAGVRLRRLPLAEKLRERGELLGELV
jgi:hypothetical protein